MHLLELIAKFIIVLFYIALLMLASNRHGKEWNWSINFWVVLAVVTANFVVLSVGGFFSGLINLGM